MEVIRLTNVINCEITPRPLGPRNIANNFTLIIDDIKVTTTEIESLYVTLKFLRIIAKLKYYLEYIYFKHTVYKLKDYSLESDIESLK